MINKVVRAIQKDRLKQSGWEPTFTTVLDDLEMVVLPTHPIAGNALCISRYPVTNASYRRFVDATGHDKPIGEHYRDGEWQGPFLPWEEDGFSAADNPVVCVRLDKVHAYCRWIRSQGPNVFLPPAAVWDFAASGIAFGITLEQLRQTFDPSVVHHRGSSPTPIDRS